jgi:acetylornithine deacetylase
MSSYPALQAAIERRTLPGESPEGQAQLQAILDQCASTDSTFKAKLIWLTCNAFEINEDTPIGGALRQQLTQVTGAPAKLSGVSYWADSGLFSAAGVPTLLLGSHGFGAHGPVEWVDLDTVQQCADIYTVVAQVFCR